MRITKNNSSSLKTRWDYLTKELTQQFSDGDVLNLDSIIYCLLYTSDAADEEDSVDLGGRRIIKKKKEKK